MTSPIPAGPIDHVAIAVRDLDSACARYVDLFGAVVEHREIVESQGVEVVFLALPGEARIELIAPTGPETPVGRFIASRGEGLHHVCVRVEDLDATLAALAADDVPLVDREPRRGARDYRIAFLHPRAAGGVLVELKEAAPSSPVS